METLTLSKPPAIVFMEDDKENRDPSRCGASLYFYCDSLHGRAHAQLLELCRWIDDAACGFYICVSVFQVGARATPCTVEGSDEGTTARAVCAAALRASVDGVVQRRQ
jgi:hypothetical protein